MKPINVLSAFDGLSGARLALERASIPVNRYFSFEIDKYAIKVSQVNHSDITYLGNIKDWKFFSDLPKIDLLIAGFPCQSYSIAGKRLGLEDLRGQLLYDLLEMIDYYRPTDLFLENVKGLLSAQKGQVVEMILYELHRMGYDIHYDVINSALVSAQNRERVYFTTWNFEQPKDRGIVLADILEDGYTDRDKSYCIDANYWKGGNYKSYFGKGRRQLIFNENILIRGAALRNQVTNRGIESQLNIRKDDKSNCVVSSYAHKLNGMVQVGTADLNGHDILKRVYSKHGKSPTLNSMGGGNREPKVDIDGLKWRKLTPIECERLQTVPDNYTSSVSSTQRYKMLGNGFNIETVAHILNYYKENKNE